jgi:hypothetical protein
MCCVRCGAGGWIENFDAHHILGRGLSVKFDLENGFCLCRDCHRRLTHATRTGDINLRDWTAEKFQERYKRISARKAQLATSFSERDCLYGLLAEIDRRGLGTAWNTYKVAHLWVGTLFDEVENL